MMVLQYTGLIALSSLCISLVPAPDVSLYHGVSNIPPVYNGSGGGWPPPPPRSHTVEYLGIYATLSECQAACVAYNNTHVSPVSGWTRCESFTYQNKHCTVMLDENYWAPSQASKSTTTGRLAWPPAKCKACSPCMFIQTVLPHMISSYFKTLLVHLQPKCART